MILKELYLYPDLEEYSDDVVHPFRDQSRSICNYFERKLKSIKFEADGFNRICVIGKSSPSAECFVNSSNVLIVEIKFHEKQYLELSEGELNDFFMTMLKTGFAKCQEQFDIPAVDLTVGLERFRSGGYVNEWCFKTKQIKALRIKCSLNCKLTTRNFHLTLLISKGGELIFEKEILKTEPDEIVFVPMFKDVNLDGNKLVVSDKYGDPVFQLMVQDLKL